MYLHLGQEVLVRSKDIVGIFDLDKTTTGKETRNFLAKAEKKGRVVNVTNELPKSFIVCATGKGKITVYISQISSSTLLKRSGFIHMISNV